MTLHEFAASLAECSRTLSVLPDGELHSAQVCFGVFTEYYDFSFRGTVIEIQRQDDGEMVFTIPPPRTGKRPRPARRSAQILAK